MQYLLLSHATTIDSLRVSPLNQSPDSVILFAHTHLQDVHEKDYIIYSQSKEGEYDVLGKYSLSKNNITHSQFYETLKDNSMAFGYNDFTAFFQQANCTCIFNCAFDIKLNDPGILKQLFSQIISLCDRDTDFLWMDDNELVYYPVKRDVDRMSAAFYFPRMLFFNDSGLA